MTSCIPSNSMILWTRISSPAVCHLYQNILVPNYECSTCPFNCMGDAGKNRALEKGPLWLWHQSLHACFITVEAGGEQVQVLNVVLQQVHKGSRLFYIFCWSSRRDIASILLESSKYWPFLTKPLQALPTKFWSGKWELTKALLDTLHMVDACKGLTFCGYIWDPLREMMLSKLMLSNGSNLCRHLRKTHVYHVKIL